MKKVVCAILCLVWSIMLCGCTSETLSEDEMYVYYVNAEGNALVSEVFPKADYEETLSLLLNTTNKGVMVPPEVELLDSHLTGNKLVLYFDGDYSNIKKSTEVLFRAAVVQTLVQVEGISFVSFFVEDKPLCDSNGNAIGLMRAEDFVSNVGYSSDSYQTTDLVLYFASEDGLSLVGVKKNNVHYNTNTSIEKLVVEQLMKGTSANGAKNTIPGTTKLLGVSVRDGICYVSFDEKFATDGFDQSPEVTIYSIVNSLIKNTNVNKVQILIEGSSDAVYKGTVDLNATLEWKNSLLEVTE